MPITRAKATALLNQREMTLYDDSRANAIRQLDAKALVARITRARDARDRARDLVQRQKLSSRDRTGNKRGTSGLANQRSKDKVELMTDILRRFEAQSKAVGKSTGKSSKQAAPAKKNPVQKSAARRAARRDGRTTARAPATAKTATRKRPRKTNDDTMAAAGKTAKKVAARKKAAAKTATAKNTIAAKATRRPLTPKQALKRTRKLLEEKQARDREPKPWETLGGTQPDPGQPGYQSSSAARRSRELHAAESRIPAIQGSISTRDRINQGKRDHRGKGDGEG